jgi:hypothetical protein
MAISQITVGSPTGQLQFTDTVMGSTVDGVKASSALVYSVFVDNTANGGAASYVKLYNLASGGVTVGTTVPDEVIYTPAGQQIEVFLFTKSAPGKTFGTALSAACVTAGGTAGVTAPSNPVIVTINYV